MTLLAGPMARQRHREPLLWCLALIGALLLHGAVVLAVLWQPSSPTVVSPQAAPVVVDIAMLASPVSKSSELPPGPQQVESAPAPKPAPVKPEPRPEPIKELPPEIEPEVVLKEAEEPVDPVEDDVEAEEEPEPAKEQPSEVASDQSAPQTTAPVMLPNEGDVASAPAEGALSQQAMEARMSWQSRLQAHLERRKRYPRRAQMLRQEGVPWISFTMNRQGEVLEVSLFQASGVESLDKEAVALVYRAEPLPKPPQDVAGDPLDLTVPVEFFIGR